MSVAKREREGTSTRGSAGVRGFGAREGMGQGEEKQARRAMGEHSTTSRKGDAP